MDGPHNTKHSPHEKELKFCRNMPNNLNLIQFREYLLSKFLGISQKDILNTGPDSAITNNGISMVTDLRRVANNIKAQAITPGGESVDYAALANSSTYRDLRVELTPQLRNFDPATLRTNAEKMSFWVNLYNVLVIDNVIHLGVQSSITDGFAGILRFFRKAAYKIGGCRTSLEDIEHGILRGNRGNPFIPGGQFGIGDPRRAWIVTPMDPRIHFVLNCASKSCPPIGIYTPEQLQQQLNLATHNFIKQEVSFDSETNTLKLSRIFQWFAVDFGKIEGVWKFIQSYTPRDEELWLALEHKQFQSKFAPYDWGLNFHE